MSDAIKHECGIALIRLKKDRAYYKQKFGTAYYGLHKLYLLMEKQHNRGQDAAGVVSLQLDPKPGLPFIYRERHAGNDAIKEVFKQIWGQISAEEHNPELQGDNAPFSGALLMGHLRYATHGQQGIPYAHPHIRQSNYMARNLVLAGNFNLTNNDELFQNLISLGQHPRNTADTVTVMERIGHFLDEEIDRFRHDLAAEGISPQDIAMEVGKRMKLENVLRKAVQEFDGGYAISGLVGYGEAFLMRDPNGIRPLHWMENEDMVAVCSERPQLMTAFQVGIDAIQELEPGAALLIGRDGNARVVPIQEQREKTSCSFERIYFSRGTDPDIYKERKDLGRLLAPAVLAELEGDLENTVFSYIPNTSELAFYGLMDAVDDHLNAEKIEAIQKVGLDKEALHRILSQKARTEKIAVKDVKLRTFITNGEDRHEMVKHVYDTTYGVIKSQKDTLVIVDDSIVRGTTLRDSILWMLDQLKPKKIIVVSSAPQIRFPDCYGIDMSRIGEFVAFQAAISLLQKTGREAIIEEVYQKCVQDQNNYHADNHVKAIYAPFAYEEVSAEIGRMLKKEDTQAEVQIVYQTVENLRVACPEHKGDWYFTGNYPTRGGNRVANQAFMNYYEKVDKRAY